MVEEVERVNLVLLVRIDGANNVDNVSNNRRLSQYLEESLVLTEFVEDGAGVDGSVDIILVLGRHFLDKRVYHHGALLLEHALHLLLLLGQLSLVLLI